jgi:hypothetical protein
MYTCGAEPLGPIDNTTNNQEFRGRIVISIPPLGLKTRPILARMKLWRGTGFKTASHYPCATWEGAIFGRGRNCSAVCA